MVRSPQAHAKGTERKEKTDVTTDNILSGQRSRRLWLDGNTDAGGY